MSGLEILPLALAGASAVAGAGGALMAGGAQASAGRFNAALMERQAQQQREAAAVEGDRLSRQRDRVLAAQRAGYAASGISGAEGTPVAVAADTGAEFDLDSMLAKWRGDAAADTLGLQAQASRRSARQAQVAGYVGAATSLLSGGYRVGRGWNTPTKEPPPSGGRGGSAAP